MIGNAEVIFTETQKGDLPSLPLRTGASRSEGKGRTFPVFVEGHTKVGKCEYWCKECLINRK